MKITVTKEFGNPITDEGEVIGYHSMKEDGDLKFESAIFPAPGIPDGEHEATLQWQEQSPHGNWINVNQPDRTGGYVTRQIYRLSPLKEQGEISGVKRRY